MYLTDRQNHLAHIGAQTARGDMSQLKIAVHQALNYGLTVNEIRDAMVQLYAYTGFPRSLNALTVLAESVQERQTQGLKTEEGKRPTPLPDNTDMLALGTKTQTELVGRTVDVSALSPDIDRYLKAHLFGDVFASNLLDWQEREIITLAALSQIQGAENQLNAHINIGKHQGLSDEQIAQAKNIVGKQMSPFATGEENTAYAQHFSGKSYLHMLTIEQVPIANVTFEPGVRNNWHIHHASKGGGQILLVTAGRGYYQEWGKPAQVLKAGDVVNIPAGVKHWHGAAPNDWFQHIAISVPGEDDRTEWLEAMSDEDYSRLV